MAKDTFFLTKKTLNLKGNVFSLEHPLVMGILNLTPDSFYDGGRYLSERTLLARAEKMLSEGAALLDVGGYSSRPGADHVPLEEEISRVAKGLKLLMKEFPGACISVDTFRSQVARVAVEEGACMVNDISGGDLDEGMFPTVAKLQVPYILMHMQGTPQNMASEANTSYKNLLSDVLDYFVAKVVRLNNMGLKDIIIDPGFGFSKTSEQNYALLKNLKYFRVLNLPILAGLSRKSMIYKALDTSPEQALNGTTVLNTIALMNGAALLRVHDVKAAVEAIKLYKTTYF